MLLPETLCGQEESRKLWQVKWSVGERKARSTGFSGKPEGDPGQKFCKEAGHSALRMPPQASGIGTDLYIDQDL